MPIENNKVLVQRYFSVVCGLDTNTEIGDFFSDDVVWHLPQSNPAIKPNPRIGHAAVMDLLSTGVWIYKPGSLDIQLQNLVSEQSRVVAQFTLKAKLSNGKDYLNDYIMLFSIERDKINGVWEYLDTLYQWQLGTFDNMS